jgi:TPP-dependent pyruvate/acetoin dehydrogenase alpha subunit
MAQPIQETHQQLDSALLLKAYRTMPASRRFDNKEIAQMKSLEPA